MASWQPGWEQQRIIHIFSTIDQNMSGNVIQQLIGFASLGDDSITIWVNTPGGEVNHTFAIVDVMKNLGVTVNTVGLGRVFSSGLIIISAGEKRYAFPGTLFMGHAFITQEANLPYHETKAGRKAQEWMWESLSNHFEKYTSLNKKEAQKTLLSTSYYFDEHEALKMGLIDKITSKIDIRK